MENFKKGYYAITSDNLIKFKPEFVVDMGGGGNIYFEGPFIKDWVFAQTSEQYLNFIKKHKIKIKL